MVILSGTSDTDALSSMQEERVRKNSCTCRTGQYLGEVKQGRYWAACGQRTARQAAGITGIALAAMSETQVTRQLGRNAASLERSEVKHHAQVELGHPVRQQGARALLLHRPLLHAALVHLLAAEQLLPVVG